MMDEFIAAEPTLWNEDIMELESGSCGTLGNFGA